MARQDVFISHSTADAEVAKLVVAQIEAHGIDCWYAKRDVPPGADWPTEIVHAIDVAKVMVLIFSVSSNSSPQVRNEVVLANGRGVRMVTFRLADVSPSDGLAYFLGGQHWIDAFPAPLEPHCQTLVACLERIVPRDMGSSIPRPRPISDTPSPKPVDDSHLPQPIVPAVVVKPEHGLAIESAKLRRVESELANFIGPIAKWKVDCAVAEVDDLDELIASLSGEIEIEKDRTRFLANCRQWLE